MWPRDQRLRREKKSSNRLSYFFSFCRSHTRPGKSQALLISAYFGMYYLRFVIRNHPLAVIALHVVVAHTSDIRHKHKVFSYTLFNFRGFRIWGAGNISPRIDEKECFIFFSVAVITSIKGNTNILIMFFGNLKTIKLWTSASQTGSAIIDLFLVPKFKLNCRRSVCWTNIVRSNFKAKSEEFSNGSPISSALARERQMLTNS